MKEYGPESIRNIAFIGHGGSGKTTLSEVILYTAGEINRIGNVLEGNTVSDYTSNEVEKQISISTSLMHIEWNGKKINILDTPGYSDFMGDVKSALKVCDTAVMIIKSAEGVEVGTEVTGKFINEFKLPSAIIINKVDNEHSTFEETLEKVKTRLTSGAIVVAFPVTEGVNFNAVVDVIKMKVFTYGDAGSKKVTESEIPADLKTKADDYRTQLIEKIAESSEELMNKYFEEGSLSDSDIEAGLKASMISRSFTPVFAISANKAVGLNNFLDFVSQYFPSPVDRLGEEAKLSGKDEKVLVKPDPTGEPVMFVFKTVAEQHVGELSLFKVYSGTIKAGLDLINESNG
ncbi:MAG: GTP-binding protein, partial [Ignavibacteriaceae bacterium]|nr:GTP-binding protein [Ignavibacteriaceae bacterium]